MLNRTGLTFPQHEGSIFLTVPNIKFSSSTICLDGTVKPPRIRQEANLYEDAVKADRSLYTSVPAANDCGALCLLQRAVAVRAIRHAVVYILGFAGDTHAVPARTGGDDHRAFVPCSTAFELQRVEATDLGSRIKTLGALCRDVDFLISYVVFKFSSTLQAFGVRRGNQVLDTHRVEELVTEAFGNDRNEFFERAPVRID